MPEIPPHKTDAMQSALGGAPATPESIEANTVQLGGRIYKEISGERPLPGALKTAAFATANLATGGLVGLGAAAYGLAKGQESKAWTAVKDMTKMTGRAAAGIALLPANFVSEKFRNWAWKGSEKGTIYQRARFEEKQALRQQMQEKYAQWGYHPGDRQSIADYLNQKIEAGYDVIDESSGHLLWFEPQRGCFLFAEKNASGKPIVSTAREMGVHINKNGKQTPLKGQDLIKWGRSFALAYDDMKANCPEKLAKLTGKELNKHLQGFLGKLETRKKELHQELLLVQALCDPDQVRSEEDSKAITAYLRAQDVMKADDPDLQSGDTLQMLTALRNWTTGNAPENREEVESYLQKVDLIPAGTTLPNEAPQQLATFVEKRKALMEDMIDHFRNVAYDKLGITIGEEGFNPHEATLTEALNSRIQEIQRTLHPLGGKEQKIQQQLLRKVDSTLAAPFETTSADLTRYLKAQHIIPANFGGEIDTLQEEDVDQQKLQRHLTELRAHYGVENNDALHTALEAKIEEIDEESLVTQLQEELTTARSAHTLYNLIHSEEPPQDIDGAALNHFIAETLGLQNIALGNLNWRRLGATEKTVKQALHRYLEEKKGVSDAANAQGVDVKLAQEIKELEKVTNPGVTEKQIQEYLFLRSVKKTEPISYVLDPEQGTFRALMRLEIDIKTGKFTKNPADVTVGLDLKLSKGVQNEIKNWWTPNKTSTKRNLYPRPPRKE